MVLKPSLPQRVICLTEETTETLYALGADDLIVGISGFTVRPKIARKTKPKVSTYLDANIEEILKLRPDIVFAWSDLQANICQQLMKEGVEVVGFNHRSVSGILGMIIKLGALIGKLLEAEKYVETLVRNLDAAFKKGEQRKRKPRVYFEEWYDPLITGITWVSEIIEICGGEDVFKEHREFHDAKRRILADNSEVIRRAPDIMLASWCGKGFKKEKVLAREGWPDIPAVKNNYMFDIHSSIILQPGPAALTEGVDIVMRIFDEWENRAQ
ncbi:MAG TPA: cobalamin-binding protein [Patescibacteria group bacterium]|nr:cobalamin-binding protein [Patescibacteria group bacterium]